MDLDLMIRLAPFSVTMSLQIESASEAFAARYVVAPDWSAASRNSWMSAWRRGRFFSLIFAALSLYFSQGICLWVELNLEKCCLDALSSAVLNVFELRACAVFFLRFLFDLNHSSPSIRLM